MTPKRGTLTQEEIVGHILKSEGWPTFTNHPEDRGGPTKGGITLETLQVHRNQLSSVAELQALGEAEAREIYALRYITRPHFDAIDDGLLRWQVVDAGVLSGTRRATTWLQLAALAAEAEAQPDGILGPKTLAAVNSKDPHFLGLLFCAIRARALMRIVSSDHSQAIWASGWMNRCMAFLDHEAARTKET